MLHTTEERKIVLPLAKRLLSKVPFANEKVRCEMEEKLAEHLIKLVFNITMVAVLNAKSNGQEKIRENDLEIVEAYVEDRCKLKARAGRLGQAGGGVLPSEYFGNDSGKYSPGSTNLKADHMIQFTEGGVIRPELQMTGGGQMDMKSVSRLAKKIIEIDDLKCIFTTKGKSKLEDLVRTYVQCMLGDLIRKPTLSNFEKILQKKRFLIFI